MRWNFSPLITQITNSYIDVESVLINSCVVCRVYDSNILLVCYFNCWWLSPRCLVSVYCQIGDLTNIICRKGSYPNLWGLTINIVVKDIAGKISWIRQSCAVSHALGTAYLTCMSCNCDCYYFTKYCYGKIILMFIDTKNTRLFHTIRNLSCSVYFNGCMIVKILMKSHWINLLRLCCISS